MIGEKLHAVLPKNQIANLVEAHIFEQIRSDQVEVYEVPSIMLLSHFRFDLAFKIFYLNMRDNNRALAESIYLEHIKAFSFGSFKEPNNDEKTSAESFITEFDSIHKNIATTGFDLEKSVLPLSSREFIRNGAHRLSAAIVENQNVFCIKTEDVGRIYDSKFFFERNVSPSSLDIAATTFAQSAENTFIALIWPTAKGNDEKLDAVFSRMVYKKSVQLNATGAHNLMPQVYPNESWIGNIEDNFKGSLNKVAECFRNSGDLRVYLFQADSLDEVLELKQQVRDIFNVGKHSIHITDTHPEVIKLSRILFNNNSIHFLNNAKPNTFSDFHKKLKDFRKFIENNNLHHEDIAIDTSMILSLYGIRKSNDVDYLVRSNTIIDKESEGINSHNEFTNLHGKTVEDLLYNATNYFYYEGIKFISFSQLFEFKKNRNSEKDQIDIAMMDAMIKNDPEKFAREQRRQQIQYFKHRLKHLPIILGIKFLKKTGLYHLVRNNYRKLKNK